MPTSSIWGKQQTLDWFKTNESNIKTILDIGIGEGTYYNLLTNNNVCNHSEWIGIEVWEPYIEKYDLRSKYHKIINEDVRNIDFNSIGKVSVTIAGDILEHITKEQSIVLVEKILDITDWFIISIPIIYYPQGEYDGNPYEEHVKPDWTHSEMMDTWGNYIKEHWVNIGVADVGVYWLQK